MLVLDMIYVDWIVKKEKSTGTLRRLSHALDPLGFEAWQLIYQLVADSYNNTWLMQLIDIMFFVATCFNMK